MSLMLVCLPRMGIMGMVKEWRIIANRGQMQDTLLMDTLESMEWLL